MQALHPPVHRSRRPAGPLAVFALLSTTAIASAQTPVLVKDIVGGTLPSSPQMMMTVGGTTFFRASDGATGFELWKSDGTAAGTTRVKDIEPGPGGSDIGSMTRVGTTLFFTANTGSAGIELWRSDGTAEGTFLLRDIRKGSESSNLHLFTARGDSLIFIADDGRYGNQLWRTDGSPAGTVRLTRGPAPATGSACLWECGRFGFAGDRLLYTAADPEHGEEPWLYTE